MIWVACLLIDILFELEYILVAYIIPFFDKIFKSKLFKYFKKILIDLFLLTFIVISITFMYENSNDDSYGILMFFVVISGLILLIRYFNKIDNKYYEHDKNIIDNRFNFYDDNKYYQNRINRKQIVENGGLTDKEISDRKKKIRKNLEKYV